MLKNCFSLLKLLYFLRTSIVLIIQTLGKVWQNRTRQAFQRVYCELPQYFEYSPGSARWNGWSWAFIRILFRTSWYFGLSFWCEWLPNDDFFGNSKMFHSWVVGSNTHSEGSNPYLRGSLPIPICIEFNFQFLFLNFWISAKLLVKNSAKCLS